MRATIADETELQSDNIGDDSEEESADRPSDPKRSKLQWQEEVINLVTVQQKQLAELTRQTKMAMSPEPTPSMSSSTSAAVPLFAQIQTSFKVTRYDPDKSAYPIREWLDDVAKLKTELNMNDMLMITKAGEALQHRSHRFYCDWRPLSRAWDNFYNDLIVAFPDRETPGALAFNAATIRSRNFDSLCDYGIEKLQVISRFHDKLPWDTFLSMVEYCLDHADARSAICMRKPITDRELPMLLSEFDVRNNIFTSNRSEAAGTSGR